MYFHFCSNMFRLSIVELVLMLAKQSFHLVLLAKFVDFFSCFDFWLHWLIRARLGTITIYFKWRIDKSSMLSSKNTIFQFSIWSLTKFTKSAKPLSSLHRRLEQQMKIFSKIQTMRKRFFNYTVRFVAYCFYIPFDSPNTVLTVWLTRTAKLLISF